MGKDKKIYEAKVDFLQLQAVTRVYQIANITQAQPH